MATVTQAATATWNTTAGNKTVTGTPALNDLIVVVAPSSGLSGGTTAVTDNNADGLGTYTQVDIDRTGFSTTGVLTVWVRNALIGSATSTVFTAAQSGSTGGGLDVFRISGMSLTGASAVRQSSGQSSGASGTTPAPVMGSAVLTSNPVIGAACCGTNASTNFTPRTGWTEATDLGYNTPATGMETAFISSGETATTLTWGSAAPSAFASIAVELDSSAPETSPALELSGFSITGPSSGDTINSVTVAVTEHQSNAAQAACTFELWDYSGTPAQIGTTQTGTASTSTSNVSTATFTGVTYSQLATLRVRVYGHANTGTSYVESVDAVSIVVNYTPGPTSATGSLGITGSAAGKAPVTASGSLAIAGAATAKVPIATTGSFSVVGTAIAKAPIVASGTLDITGTGSAAGPGATATGSLSLAGGVSAKAPVATSGSLGIVGVATARAPAAAAGGLSVVGSATAPSVLAVGSLSVSGSASAKATATATGSLTLAGTASVTSGTVTIVVLGDMQPAQHTTAPPTVVAAQISALNPLPAYVLIAGDCTNDGDNTGFTGEFANLDTMYGGIKTILRPVPGNHDWGNVVGSGTLAAYDTYWGAQAHSGATPPHFYSFDTPNGWHIIALDSDQQWVGSLGNPSSTYSAVAADLAANAGKPLIAYWHHPRWSDGTNATDPGGTGDTTVVSDIWNLLYDYHCDLVFTGHCHSYQRFPKLGKTGSADSAGIREFVVGTGGSGLFALTSTQRSTVNSYQAAAYDQLNSKWFGYLTLTLTPATYSWTFTSQNAVGSENPGAVLDSGGPVTSNQFMASASGSLDISGTAVQGAPASASGSLSVIGTVQTPGGNANAAGSLAISGTAAARTLAIASGSISLAGTAIARVAVVAAGFLDISGISAAAARAIASGSLVINGTASAAGPGSTAAGSLSLVGAVVVARAAIAASGSLAIAGAATAGASATATGAMSLAGAVQAAVRISAIAVLAINGSVSAASYVSASGSFSIIGIAAAFVTVPSRDLNATVLADILSASISTDALLATFGTDDLSAEVTGG